MTSLKKFCFIQQSVAWIQSCGLTRNLAEADRGEPHRLSFALTWAGFRTLIFKKRSQPGILKKRLFLPTWFSALVLVAAPALADWTLNNEQSQLSFISIKNGDIAEVHRFDHLDGSFDGKGNVKLIIQLASVDTAIPIRDERMREMLFNTNAFPAATLTANVDASEVSKLKAGEMMVSTLKGQLNLHGKSSPLTAELVVARLAANTLLVSSHKPLVLQAGNFDLVEGVEKLREVAGLASISKTVPVSFVLTFNQK